MCYTLDMKAKDLLIYSDMDGTMLSDWSLGPVVPERNRQAIMEFTKLGGAISIATGRQYSDTLSFFPKVMFSAPLVLGNGSNIYDQKQQKILYKQTLPLEYKKEALDYFLTHPDIFLVCADEFSVYQIMTNTSRDDNLRDTFKRLPKTMDEYLYQEMTKVVYVTVDDEKMFEVIKDVSKLEHAYQVDSMQSSSRYLEMVSKGVSKANSIKKAIEFANLQNRTLVCIGDYMNDYEMLKIADIPVCPSNSAKEIKEISKIITCDNNSGAIADLIEKLVD